MPSADHGAPLVRPADVERWLAELGPGAARAGRSRRDRRLGPRARRPPPLRPPRDRHPRSGARASSCGRTTRRRSATCSASRTGSCCAGTTSSRSRSSRVGEDERPLLAVELPIARRGRRPAGPRARPDPRRRGPAARRIEGLALDRRPDAPTRAAGRRATRASSPATRPAAGAPDGPMSALAPGRPGPPRALVVAIGLLAAPGVARSPRSAPPRRISRSSAGARYDVQPTKHRVRVTVDADAHEPPQGHDHQALLLRPGVPRGPARASRAPSSPGPAAGAPSIRVTKTTKRLHDPAAQPRGRGCSAARPRPTRCASTSWTAGGAATRDLRIGDSLVSFPVWAYATDATPGSTVSVVFPAGFDVEVEPGDDPGTDERLDKGGRSSGPAGSTSR